MRSLIPGGSRAQSACSDPAARYPWAVPPAFDPADVEDAQQGHPGARDRLVDAALPLVLGWCARLGGPRIDAEDAAHDALLTALARLPPLDDPARFEPWLFGVTRSTLAAHRRRAWVRRWTPWPAGLDAADPSAGPGRSRELSEVGEQVRAVLERLPAAQREVLVLCAVEERPTPEVAALLDLPEGTVKSRLRLGRERFRRLAEQRGLDAWVLPTAEGSTR